MDAKDPRTESTLDPRSHDGSSKYTQSATAITNIRNKLYLDDGSNSLGKVEVPSSRPCAVIGPDRVVPPSAVADPFPKKPPPDQWMFADPIYRRPPDYPMKMTNYQNQTRNISPRQTFQENMQRIMMPPTYNSVKMTKDPNLVGDGNLVPMPQSSKMNISTEPKFCDVPYNVSPLPTEQKIIRDVNVPSVSAINQSAPYGWNTSNTVRPTRPYGATELYQYPDYPGSSGARTMPVGRPVRNFHEETPSVFPERFFSDGNIRYKPYPQMKEGYAQPRYECINNYPNPYHPPPYPPPRYDIQKSHNPHLYSAYSQVPVKYFDNRMNEPVIDGYQRSNPQPNYNVSYPNQFIHPAYGPVPGNLNLQNKLLPYATELPIKANSLNKLAYENKLLSDFENVRNKQFIPENYYGPKSQIMISKPQISNIQNTPSHPYYRKDYPSYRNYDSSKYGEMATNVGNASLRFPSQFSPNVIGMSPLESNDHMHSLLLEDSNYLSHPSMSSMRCPDQSLNRIHPDMFIRHDPKFSPMRRPMATRIDTNNSGSAKDKKNIDVRQFLQQWNDDDDNNVTSNPKQEVVQNVTDPKLTSEQEQLYVLGLVNVPSDELGKYDHIQKISKLPDNIKGYNSLELLNQFEEAIGYSNMNNKTTSTPRNYQRNYKTMPIQRAAVPPLQRPISPLDVESKISQSVIHKEVGCNFEIKPCSPKMLNVEIATPAQTVLKERVIEKLSNPHLTKSPINSSMVETLSYKGTEQDEEIVNNKNPSCKMNQNQYNTHNYTVPPKSDYSLSDLESSSGVCLASLPRLDNEIELNFPEVNQQFINANAKTDTVITTTNPDCLPESTQSKGSVLVSPEQLSPNTDTAQKLFEFRKSKKEDRELNSDVITHPQAVRTDSVIIKNPETVKESALSNDSTMLLADMDLKNCEKLENSDVKDPNIALDFSVNKYSFGYDVNKLEDDFNETKNIISPNICETNENIPVFMLEPKTNTENITKEILNPEISKSEIETKIQDPSFLLESSDLEPEQKDISNHNISDSKLLSENESDTGSSDDSNSQFCEANIISHENVIKEEVDSLLSNPNNAETEHTDNNKMEESMDLVITNFSRSKEIPKLNGDGSELINVLNENVVSIDNSEKKLNTDSLRSSTSHKKFNTQDKLVNYEVDTGASCKGSDKAVCSEIISSETEQDAMVHIESTNINEIESNDTYSYKSPTNDKNPTTLDTDTTVSFKALEKSLLSDVHEKAIDHKIFKMKDAEEPLYRNKKQVSKGTDISICRVESKSYEKNFENHLTKDIKNTNVEDISQITGICFTALSLELYNRPDADIKDCEINPDLELDSSDDFPSSEKDSSGEYNETVKMDHNNSVTTSANPISEDCKVLTTQNNIIGKDNEFINIVDYNVDQKSQVIFEEEGKQTAHINKIQSQDTNLPLKLEYHESCGEPSVLDTDYNSSVFETTSTDLEIQNENSKITLISDLSPISLTEEIITNANNAIVQTIRCDSALLNNINTDCLTPTSDINSDNSNKTVGDFSEKKLSYNHYKKTFCLKLFSPQIYNLIMYETGTCTDLMKIHEHAEKNLDYDTKFNPHTLSPVSDVVDIKTDVTSCNSKTSKSLLSMREENLKLKTDHLPHVINTNMEIETCNALITTNATKVEEIFTKDNNQVYLGLDKTELYQVVSLKNIVASFIGNTYPNLDIKSINKNMLTLESSTSANTVDTSQIKTNICNTYINVNNSFINEKVNRHLKRSFSESDLSNYEQTENSQVGHNNKRQKIYTKKELETELIAGNLYLHNNRRNSISTILNEEDVSFCILIDDNCIIEEECEDFDRNSTVEDSECFEYVETDVDIHENCCDEDVQSLLPIAELNQTKYLENDILNNFNEHQSDEGAWIEDIACVETVVSDNVAEDIEVRSESSPLTESISDYNSDGESSYSFNNNLNDHADKVKHIYEGCHDNDHLMETLFRTPQMNVNKTLVKDNEDADLCIDQERADLENMLSESMSGSKTNVSDVTTLARDSLIEARNLTPHNFNEEMLMDEPNHQIETDDDSHINTNATIQKSENAFVHSCESSFDSVFTYNALTENTTQYSSSSSSPEVSSTTSEEKCSSILLKITSYNGSIVSEISNSREIKRISCKYTEKNDYNSTNSNRPLITKAAQKYIPPISETIQDLKVKLPLPQHSLLKLQQLKHSKEHLKSENPNRYFPSRPDIPKKPKPKFEDVLKSIDDIQFKMHKEKKKIKKFIPKVVIKKNGNGSHYTSSSSRDPDLTGLKWQPWVFIERNGFIDKMATKRKTEAIYSHRKKEYVFRDKFQKYKSVGSAKFVITQPKLDDKGHLKYTIKLKHNY